MCTTRPRYALPGAAATRPACALHSTLRVGDTRGLPGGTRLARRVHAGGGAGTVAATWGYRRDRRVGAARSAGARTRKQMRNRRSGQNGGGGHVTHSQAHTVHSTRTEQVTAPSPRRCCCLASLLPLSSSPSLHHRLLLAGCWCDIEEDDREQSTGRRRRKEKALARSTSPHLVRLQPRVVFSA
jgi:hypothetical protein